jgi:hypothetical protein
MQIEEVLKQRECFLEALNEIRVDFINTAKTIVQQLEQDPTSATDDPFKDCILRSIDILAFTAKLQPQDAGNVIGSLEENKGAEQMHPLLKYAAAYVEVFEALEQQTSQNLAEVNQILGKQAA